MGLKITKIPPKRFFNNTSQNSKPCVVHKTNIHDFIAFNLFLYQKNNASE